MSIKLRLIILSFLQFAVWGAYLTSMGGYLAGVGIGNNIGWFYSVQGFVSIFMPGLIGIVADRWIQGQRLLGFCHFIAAAGMLMVAQTGMSMGAGNLRTDIPLVCIESSFLYAYLGTIERRIVQRHRTRGIRSHQGFPAHPHFWHHWLYRIDVDS